eukprot:scaffold3734_cov425-Prasinococcus_capsulatus_cf.AAC.3
MPDGLTALRWASRPHYLTYPRDTRGGKMLSAPPSPIEEYPRLQRAGNRHVNSGEIEPLLQCENSGTEPTPCSKPQAEHQGPQALPAQDVLPGRDPTLMFPANIAGHASVGTTAANLMNNIVGAGQLALPYVLLKASLVWGSLIIALTALVSGYSLSILAKCCDSSGMFEYRSLGRRAYGQKFGLVVQTVWTAQSCNVVRAVADSCPSQVMLVYTLGTCCAYNVIIGESLPRVIDRFFGDNARGFVGEVLERRAWVILFVAGGFLFPLSTLRDLSALRLTSVLGVLCCVFVMLITRTDCALHQIIKLVQGGAAQGHIEVARVTDDILLVSPIVSVACCSHYNGPRLYMELRDRSIGRMKQVIGFAFGVILTIYLATAACGYVTLGGKTRDDVLEAYGVDDILATAGSDTPPLHLDSSRFDSKPLPPLSLGAVVYLAATPSYGSSASKQCVCSPCRRSLRPSYGRCRSFGSEPEHDLGVSDDTLPGGSLLIRSPTLGEDSVVPMQGEVYGVTTLSPLSEQTSNSDVRHSVAHNMLCRLLHCWAWVSSTLALGLLRQHYNKQMSYRFPPPLCLTMGAILSSQYNFM